MARDYFRASCNNIFRFFLGNLLGPVVNTTIQGGLEKFFRQPTGCGEQNMIGLAPNVYVLGYLSATKQLSGDNEENAYRFIQSGELRVMAFKFKAGRILFGYFCLIKASPLRHKKMLP